MSSVWYATGLDSKSWQPSRRDEKTVNIDVTVSSWPLVRLDELVSTVDDATTAEGRPFLITPRDIDLETGAQTPQERAQLQPVLELHRQLAEGDILLPRAPHVPAVLVTPAHEHFAFSSAFIPLRVNAAALEPRYLWTLLSSSRGLRARFAVADPASTWDALKQVRIAVPSVAVQSELAVDVPGVEWIPLESRWQLTNLRGVQSWGFERLHSGDRARLSEIATIGRGAVNDADIFAVAGTARVPVVTQVDRNGDVPGGWATVDNDRVSRGSDIAMSPYFPFRARAVPAGWSVARRFLVLRARESTAFGEPATVESLVAWFNSIGGRSALSAVASGTVLPRVNVSALGRVVIPERVVFSTRLAVPLPVQLEHALGLL